MWQLMQVVESGVGSPRYLKGRTHRDWMSADQGLRYRRRCGLWVALLLRSPLQGMQTNHEAIRFHPS